MYLTITDISKGLDISDMSKEYSCPKCAGKVRNRGTFTPRYFKLKNGGEVGYIYHQVVDNQGRLRQHSIGLKAPPRSLKSDVSKNPLLDTSDIEILKGLRERCEKNRETSRVKVLDKILQHFS
jgi:hypothetical protein